MWLSDRLFVLYSTSHSYSTFQFRGTLGIYLCNFIYLTIDPDGAGGTWVSLYDTYHQPDFLR
jgi:hypothetical protein